MKRCTYHSKVEVLSPEQERCRTADPRNPQPGQVWERGGDRMEVVEVSASYIRSSGEVYKTLKLAGMGDRPTIWTWRKWACPLCLPWRRRKHWARCVEWE